MISLLMLTTLSMTLNVSMTGDSAADHDYTLAYKRSIQENKPLMVVVGADWCPACTQLKDSTLQTMRQSGELEEVNVAVVDRDRDPELARRLMKGENRIPQVIVFSKDSAGRWQSRKLTGYQSPQPIRSLIRRAVTLGRS